MTLEISLEDETEGIMKFFDDNIVLWVNETIIEDTKNVAMAANMSDNYIDAIKFIKTGFAKGKVVNVHPFAKLIENGSKAHIITPKGGTTGRNTPKALTVPPKYNGGILAKVDHPGTRAMLIMTKGKEIGLPRFISRSKQELDNFKRGK